MRRALVPATLLLLPLAAACSDEPENIQARAANASAHLEQRYQEIEAEAENDTAGAAAPLENEANALLANLADPGNAEANLADQPPENAARAPR